MKKIMFSDKNGLTKAVIEGRKTQTRRIIKTSDAFERVNPDFDWDEEDIKNWKNDFVSRVNNMTETEKKGCFNYLLNHPRYKVGEVVAVAQSYRDCGGVNEGGVPMWEIISKKAGGTNAGWNNKMFVRADLMPHQIRITDVRVERLQDISEEDAIAEGITYAGLTYEDYGEPMFIIEGCKQTFGSARDAYAWLIDKISGKGTWQSNPYVFVYDFVLVK